MGSWDHVRPTGPQDPRSLLDTTRVPGPFDPSLLTPGDIPHPQRRSEENEEEDRGRLKWEGDRFLLRRWGLMHYPGFTERSLVGSVTDLSPQG